MELSFAAEYAIEGDTLTGVAHVFGQRGRQASTPGVLHEFTADAFLKSKPIAFYHHDLTKPLGIPTTEIKDGRLHFAVQLGHQTYANDLRENVASGLMVEASFGVKPVKWTDHREGRQIIRTHTQSDLYDISPVVKGEMSGTSTMLHNAAPDHRAEAARARYRVMEGKR